MIIDQEQLMLETQDEFDSMQSMLKDAAGYGLQLHEVESNLWERLLKIGHLSIQGYIDSQGTGDLCREIYPYIMSKYKKARAE